MKRTITVLLMIVMMISLCACTNEDYTKVVANSDTITTEYYTSGGDLYQTIFFDRETRISVITTYYWTTNERAVQILDRIEIVRINEKGEIVD